MYNIRGIDQKEYGPVSAEVVRQWIAEDRANAQTLAHFEGTADWKPLATFVEFSVALTAVGRPPALPGRPASLPPRVRAAPKSSGLAITSAILGMTGLFTCGIGALFGLVLGVVSLLNIRKHRDQVRGQGWAITGICASGVTLLLLPIIAALLLPALAKVKGKAQTISCVGNVRQLTLAVRIYANDNNERYPSANQWCDGISVHVPDSNTFQCPMHRGQRGSFAFNQKLDGKKESEVDPATVLIFESDLGWNAVGDAGSMIKAARHGTYTIGFADGHVEQVSASRLSQLRWEP